MSYNIFQIKISEEIYDFVNGPEGGHTETAKKYPLYHARMETSFDGAKGYKPEMFEHYTKVCEVAGFEDRNLETVFKILNGYYYNEETDTDETFDAFVSGFEMRTFLNKKTKEVKFSEKRMMVVIPATHIIPMAPNSLLLIRQPPVQAWC